MVLTLMVMVLDLLLRCSRIWLDDIDRTFGVRLMVFGDNELRGGASARRFGHLHLLHIINGCLEGSNVAAGSRVELVMVVLVFLHHHLFV